MTQQAIFIHSDEIERFHYPAQSPFKTERAAMTRSVLRSRGFYTGDGRTEVPPINATVDELLCFHTKEYLDALQRVSSGRIDAQDLFMGLGTADCPVFQQLFDYARLAAGGTLTAARQILAGHAHIAFNPSGGYHHAHQAKAEGFCYINDVVLGCQVLAKAGKRVLCLDLDAHHGNGTQNAFYDRSDIFTISLHESGETLFPWGGFENEIGAGAGIGYNLNMPFPAGTDDDLYTAAFNEIIPPLIKAYDPDVIVLELGMDVLSVDPLTHLRLTNNAVADSILKILSFDKPILAVGGGGYSPDDTARGWALAWCILCQIEREEDLYMGLGGVFLGSSEWNAGLRDKHIYLLGNEKAKIVEKVEASVELIKKSFFPLHGL
jgi:acetoin utilization protein AcuC